MTKENFVCEFFRPIRECLCIPSLFFDNVLHHLIRDLWSLVEFTQTYEVQEPKMIMDSRCRCCLFVGLLGILSRSIMN